MVGSSPRRSDLASGLGERLTLTISTTYDGAPLPDSDRITLHVEQRGGMLAVEFSAPFAADPAPSEPLGSTWRLWEHEVVELILVSHELRYVELEWGPHGHSLALQLEGVRHITGRHLPMAYTAQLTGDRWTGAATIALDALFLPIQRANAFAISGVGAARRYSAAYPLATAAPDFHVIQRYPTLNEIRANPTTTST